MAFQISPGVNVTETDLTTIIPIIAATKAGFAGVFNWGPADDIILVDSENTLIDVFSTPDDNNFEHFFTAANYLGYGNALQVVRVVAAGASNAGAAAGGPLIKNKTVYDNTTAASLDDHGVWLAKYAGALGNSLKVSAADSDSFVDSAMGGATFSLDLSGITVSSTNTGFTFANNFAVGDTFLIGTETHIVAAIGGATSMTVTTASSATHAGVGATARWAYQAEFDSAPGTSDFASNRGGSDDELHVVVVDEDGEWSGTRGTVLERFAFVSKATNARKDNGAANFYKTVINDTSKYIWWGTDLNTNWASSGATVDFSTAPIAGSGLTASVTNSLVGGANGSASPTLNAANSGYSLFADSETVDVSLLLSGPATPTLAGAIVDIVDSRKDCVAFVSPEKTDVVNVPGSERANVLDYRNTQLNKSSSYSVLDCGWKYQYDRYNDVFRYVPLNGDIAGLCARTDETNDPWWSPAGFNRGQLRGVVKLAWNPVKADRDDLYKAGVNPIVSFPGEGTVLYGDKTLQSKPSAFDRINVRRLFIILEKAIATAAKFTLFEFNDEFTRSQFKNMIEPFLRDIQGRRGITDFKVVCDSTNNTSEVIDRNEFVADIFIKPNRSINFIQLNFVAARSGVDFSEIGGFGL